MLVVLRRSIRVGRAVMKCWVSTAGPGPQRRSLKVVARALEAGAVEWE